ncbi:MAG: hypothetical protein AAF196_11655 [Planctomycetota bacterium]
MTTSSSNSLTQSFLIGALVGGFASFATISLMSDDTDRMPEPATIVADDSRADDDRAPIEAGNAAISTSRRATRPDPDEDDSDDSNDPDLTANGEVPAATVEAVETSDRFRQLMDELRLLVTSGVIERHYQGNEDGLLQFLVNVLMQGGQPHEALAMLQRYEPSEQHLGLLYQLASSLQSMGDAEATAQAALLGLKIGPGNTYFLDLLQGMDPNAALAEVEAMLATASEGNRAMREIERIAMLFIAGQGERGLAEIDRLIQEGREIPDHLWERLLTADPVAAEQRFAQMMQGLDAASASNIGLRWIRSILAQGDGPRALEQLNNLLAAAPDNADYRNQLASMDREAALRWSSERILVDSSSGMLEFHGSMLVQAGRQQEAIDIYMQLLDSNPNSSARWQLLQLAPLQAAPRLVEIARVSNDDELYGDIADALWREGHHAQAAQYWRTANRIDPDDGEWTGKIASVEAGRDPL